MTVLTDKDRISYLGDGATTAFTYDFEVPRSEEVIVTLDNVATSAYTISGVGNPAGGTITFTLAPALNVEILILRDVPLTQLTDLLPYDAFPAETVEGTLDRIVFMIQKVTGLVFGAFTKSVDTPENVSTVVPKPVAGYFWTWNALGQNIEYVDVNNLGTNIITTATDTEITIGIETQTRLVSPFQTKLAVTTHETPPIMDINNVQWVEVLAALPGTPAPNTLYLIKQ